MDKNLWQVKSRHALVTCILRNTECIVEKEIAPNVVTNENSKWVNQTSMYFREGLKSLGVPLAEPYICSERDGKAIQTSPFIGPDLEQIVHSGKATRGLLEIILHSIKEVLLQKKSDVGIDARLSNFCLGSDGIAYYVDTFPPLVKYEGSYLVHFPNPTDPDIIEQEFKRKFNCFGILRRLRFSILEQDSSFKEKDILCAIRNVMGENFTTEVANFFNTFLDHMSIDEALEYLSLDDPDGIREVALNFIPKKGKGRTDFFSEIFDLSSNFCPINLTRQERLERIRELFSKHKGVYLEQ